MSRPRGTPAREAVVAKEQPRAGGRYIRDPETGKLSRVAGTDSAPAEPDANDPASQQEG